MALCTTGLENYTVPLGLGKWITSVTMTIFYVLLYYVWRQRYQIKRQSGLTAAVYGLAGVRIALCMMPQNQWLSASAPLSWGIYRNIPFALLGLLVIVLFYRSAKERAEFRLLHSGGAVGRYHPHDWNADDPQDLRLCMDGSDWLLRHEKGMQIKEE